MAKKNTDVIAQWVEDNIDTLSKNAKNALQKQKALRIKRALSIIFDIKKPTAEDFEYKIFGSKDKPVSAQDILDGKSLIEVGAYLCCAVGPYKEEYLFASDKNEASKMLSQAANEAATEKEMYEEEEDKFEIKVYDLDRKNYKMPLRTKIKIEVC